jgi:hypothetical protein
MSQRADDEVGHPIEFRFAGVTREVLAQRVGPVDIEEPAHLRFHRQVLVLRPLGGRAHGYVLSLFDAENPRLCIPVFSGRAPFAFIILAPGTGLRAC